MPKETTTQPRLTEYVVLRRATGDDAPSWIEVGTIKAASSRQAMKAVAAKELGESEAVTLVACPVSSWRPLTAKVERTTRLSFS